MGGVRLHLVEVLFMSSLSFCLFGIKVGADLDQCHFRYPGHLLPYDEGLLPPSQLHLPREELLLQLFYHRH
jgi:hypothetical protein